MKAFLTPLCLLLLIPGLALAQAEAPVSFDDSGLTRIVGDTVIFGSELDALGNWEPYSSVLGTSTFLIEANRFAEDTTDLQNYGVALQPAEGGEHAEVAAFYTDAGDPWNAEINLSRQNGNPGRVAGDKRPGAVHYMTGAEISPHAFEEFNSGDRWDDGVIRAFDARYGAVQVFSLDTDTLVPTPTTNVIDPVLGLGSASGDATANNQTSRFGGDIRALDNGNFVVVVEDRSGLFAGGTAASAAVITPEGDVVAPGFVINTGDIWSNVAAHKGGFCVRQAGILWFHDNEGNEVGIADQLTDVVSDTGRGDGTRLESHINSDYVYLAGFDGLDSIRVAVYDARTQEFVAETNVNELTPDLGGTDEVDYIASWGRVELAVDALNRIAVAFVESNSIFNGNDQVVCRVLQFNPDDNSFEYLTPSFLAFQNSGEFDGIRTTAPSISMTTRQIVVAAKGEINSGGDPSAGVDTAQEANFYTVFSHPDPQDDPTEGPGTAAREWMIH